MNNDTYDNDTYETETYYGEVQQEEEQAASSSRTKKRRKKRPKKRRKKHYALKLLILAAVCVLLYFFAHSAFFTVENIQLEKNDVFTLERVQELTGIKKGDNLFEVDMKECEEKMEERPYVNEADFSRKLPDTINISLDLREPSTVVLSNGKYVMLDKDGNVLEIRKKLPHYTFLDGLTVQEAELGQPVKIKETEKYEEYTSLVKKMNESDLFFRKMVITEDGVKLYARKNLYCVGSMKNIIAGMEDGNLKAVLYTLSKKGVTKGVVKVSDDQYYSFSKTNKK